MRVLFLIPARGGSKGIPGKNIKLLGGSPLISYSIDVAREFAEDIDICISTDDDKIIEKVEELGLQVPFRRPKELASDTAGSYDVILHAVDHYAKIGIDYEAVMLLQPTSPFRKKEHLEEIISLFDPSVDMIVSVSEATHYNPYFSLFEEDKNGNLSLSKESEYMRRQDCPKVYAFNGSIYLINVKSLRSSSSMRDFYKIKKYVMDEIYSVDIDKELDWLLAESIINNRLL